MFRNALIQICLFVLFFNCALAQITGVDYVKDSAAIHINDQVVNKLCAHNWYLHASNFMINEDTLNYNVSLIPSKYDTQGSFSLKHREETGKWAIVNSTYIEHQVDSVEQQHYNGVLGPFVIYEATDTSLLLVKVLTSDGGNRIHFHFKDRPNTDAYNALLRTNNFIDKSNKVKGILSLRSIYKYEIYDYKGNLVRKGFSKNVLLKKLPKGTYYITCNKITHKFIKE